MGKDILCISSIDWDFIWQGHQEIMAALAEAGHRVLFVENTGVRAPRIRDLPRIRQRIRNWWRGTMGFRQERPNLFVYSPIVLPFPYSTLVRRVNRVPMLRAIRRWMRATGFARPIVWTFLPTPLGRDLVRELDPTLTIYYCIDDLASSSRAARRIAKSEAWFLRTADLVFVTSSRLQERAARLSGRVHLFPFGVNYRRFEHVRNGPDDVPVELAGLPRPVVGYVGGVHQWLDQDLLAEVSGAMPDVSFVLIGPGQTDLSRLARSPNVHWLGARPHPDLPRHIKAFDVGLVPYRVSDYTASVYPTKLNEYLAMGIPVVATDLPEIRRFNSEHGDVVTVAPDAERFVEAIRAAIAERSPVLRARRIDAARENSWESRIASMWKLIEGALAERETAGRRWEERLRRLYGAARRRTAKAVAIVATMYLLFFQTQLVWWLAEPLRMSAPVSRVDAIVVFAGGVGESGAAGGGYQERVRQAVTLYHQGAAPWLVFSSGYVYAFPEAKIMQELAVSNGVPPSAIILETRAANTYENVLFVRRILDAHHWRRVALVSSPYHMRRATLTAKRVAPEIAVIPVPAAGSQFYAHHRGATLDQILGILHEYAAIVVYWWRGWI